MVDQKTVLKLQVTYEHHWLCPERWAVTSQYRVNQSNLKLVTSQRLSVLVVCTVPDAAFEVEVAGCGDEDDRIANSRAAG